MINILDTELFLGNIEIYLDFISFPYALFAQMDRFLSRERQRSISYIVNNMDADTLLICVTRALKAMALTCLTRNNLSPAHKR